MNTHTTISDCYNGYVGELFTPEFQNMFKILFDEFNNERISLLKKRTLKSDLSHAEEMSPSWIQTVSGLKNSIKELQEIICIRELSLNERNYCIDGINVPAGPLELFTTLFHTQNRKNQIIVYVPKCESSLESKWWEALTSKMCELLNIDKSIIKINFLFEAVDVIDSKNKILDLSGRIPKNTLSNEIYSKVI